MVLPHLSPNYYRSLPSIVIHHIPLIKPDQSRLRAIPTTTQNSRIRIPHWFHTYYIVMPPTYRHPFLSSLRDTFSYRHCQAPFPIIIARHPFLLSLPGTFSYCHCEAQSAEAISNILLSPNVIKLRDCSLTCSPDPLPLIR